MSVSVRAGREAERQRGRRRGGEGEVGKVYGWGFCVRAYVHWKQEREWG